MAFTAEATRIRDASELTNKVKFDQVKQAIVKSTYTRDRRGLWRVRGAAVLRFRVASN